LDIQQLYDELKSRLPEHMDLFGSQEGEDILIKRLLKSHYNRDGIYVDVGAHDPLRFSTTAHYYMRGWRGINIEPNEGVIDRFLALRPNDINLKLAVGSVGEWPYYRFKESAFNTFDKEQLAFALTKTQLLDESTVEKKPLKVILDENLPKLASGKFVFLNVDVEGNEMEVLSSNDWAKYRPYLVLVEVLKDEKLRDIDSQLNSWGYFFVARTKNTYFYAEQEFKKCYVD
tara:strand:- start:116 stop:805 length:690 start_codon:yes stop_codon:yes gene_type:complete